MKIAMDWIGEYVTPAPEAAVAADALMNAGLPVESVTDATGVKGPTKVLDVEVTSNRTDCFCHVGLARELSALTGGSFKMPMVDLKEMGPAVETLTNVGIDDPVGCPYYSARVIRGVKVGPSPEWLRRRLEAIGLRPINNVVDVTNFVLMELGQPLHAFDYDLLEEKRVVARRAVKGEKMLAIDGHEYAIEPHMLVIADAKKPVAIAGVMGGKATEVTEKTINVLLESARFDPISIRTTSRALGLKSDSSYRFERGIDPSMAELASRRAMQLIMQVAGGELAMGVVKAGTVGLKTLQVTMRFKRFREIMGIPIVADRAMGILSALGFGPGMDEGNDLRGTDDDVLYVRVPPHRLDIDREIDVIEEIARVNGYQHVPTLNSVTHAVTPESTRERAMRAIRAAMVEAGFSEAVTVTFIPEGEGAPFGAAYGAATIKPQHHGWKTDVLRPSLLPSLLAVRRTNQYAGDADARVFETASVFLQQGDASNAPTERRMLSAVAGDVMALLGALKLVVERLNPVARAWVDPVDFGFYARGTSGEVRLSGPKGVTGMGNAGLFTTELQKKYDLRHAVAGMELDLESLIAIYEPVRRALAVPRFPGVKRDLSVVVDEAVRWADVRKAIEGLKPAFLESIEFVTTFRSTQVGVGKKSLTLALEFRDPSRTLKSEEVDAQVQSVVALLAKEFAGALRV